MSTYDKHYQEPRYFGDPYPDLMSFFSDYELKGNILDLGCGQGRDSIALARMGYSVTGVDASKVGISYLLTIAEIENLKLRGIVGDMYSYDIDETVDIVLLDSILHFYKRDKKKETEFLLRIMRDLKVGGLLCVLIWKSKKIEKELEVVLKKVISEWDKLVDKYIDYPAVKMEMRMMVLKKLG